MIKRTVWNIIVEAVSLVVFVSMISTGLLLKFVLPPGSGREEMILKEGRGYGRTIDLYLGLTRHEWGQIHFYIALSFLILLLVHLSLHWSWIKAMTFGTKTHPQPLKRKIMTTLIIVIILFLLSFPWIGQKATYTKTEFIEFRGIQINE